MIAPDSNRSATARSITTRPAAVGRGGRLRRRHGRLRHRRHAGRLRALRRARADRGLRGRPDRLRHQPRLQPRRRHHLLGHGRRGAGGRRARPPGVAVSQQSLAREMDFRLGERFDFDAAAAFTARIVEEIEDVPLPEGTLLNINVPAGDLDGVEVARLGKRIYRDQLELEDEESGRRQYRIYGDSPVLRRRGAPTSPRSPRAASRSRRCTSTSPTEPGSSPARLRPRAAAGAGRGRARRSPVSAAASVAELRGSSRTTATATTSSTTPRSATTPTTRCSTSCARSSASTPSWSRPTRRRSGSAASRSPSWRRSATCSRCSRSPTRARRRSCAPGSRGCARTSRARGSRTRTSRFVAEPKIDGLAISLVYRDGVLERGATRGNGEVGEDVTHNLRTIGAIPLRIDDAPPLLEVRGEVYMSLPDFTALNERRAEAGLSTFMNPRNSAAGRSASSTRRSPPSARCRCGATAIGATEGLAFGSALGGARVAARARLPRQRRRRAARQRGRGRRAVPGAGRSAAARSTSRSTASWSRSTTSSCSGGSAWSAATRAGRSPGSSRPPPRSRRCTRSSGTSASSATCTRSRELEPVHVGGVTVKLATLHNEEDLARKDVRPGDEVIVLRAGDVIPQVRLAGAARGREPGPLAAAAPPERCPSCDTPTVKPEGAVFTRCPNRDCPDRRWQLLKHFAFAARWTSTAWGRSRSRAPGARAWCGPPATSTG